MIRLSDPVPAFCSACHNQPVDSRYVDFDAVHDGGQWVGTALTGAQYYEGTDDLHICEACMRRGVEVLDFKPELHSRQLREIRRQEIVIEHKDAVISKLRAALGEALDGPEPEPRRVGRPRKVAA